MQTTTRLLTTGILAASVLVGCDDDSTEPPEPITFDVTIENVSQAGTVESDRIGGAVPVSPGTYVIFDGTDPSFTPGSPADTGTRLIAEDGFPGPQDFISVDTEVEILEAADNAKTVGVFSSEGAGDVGPDNPAIFPGESTTFSFSAVPGDRLQIETMFVQSNDWFYAFTDGGLELFDGDEPITGDVTAELDVYDAGTEVDAAPGTGPTTPPGAVQKPVQDPTAVNVGTDESEPVQRASLRHDFDIPANEDVILVTIEPR